MSVTRASALTPGRRRTANKENIYHEPGKGRKTGVTLRDTGIRDEHGFEPVSGIFATPTVHADTRYSLPEPLLAPSVTRSGKGLHGPLTLKSPRKTHIGGSPIRRSPQKSFPVATEDRQPEGTPTALSKSSVVVQTPRKSPEPALRTRRSMFAFASPVTQVSRRRSASIELDQVIQDVTQSLQDPDSVLLADDIRDDIRASTLSIYPSPSHNRPAPYSAAPSYDGSQEPDQSRTQATDEASSISNGKRKRSSGVAPFAVMHMSSPPAAAELDDLNSSQKRRRSSRNVQVEPSPPYTEPSPPSTAQEHYDEATMQPAEQSFTEHPIDHQEVVHDTIATDPDTILETTEIDGDSIHERTEVDIVDVYDTLATIEENEAEPSHLQGKKAQATRHPPRSKQALYSQNDPNRAHTERRGAGVRSSVRLRSVTPFDDSTKTTRSGRVVHKPFQFWKNEGPVWEHGQMTGVTRAEDVPAEKRNFNRRRTNTRTRLNKDNVEEEIPEDLLPEAWEQETKIIRGPVNFWNPETGENDGSEVSEDIAFSHHASKYVDAGDGSFKYAKLVRIPFFGAGLLEIPPGGSKSAKSSRNMQMIFFIYEGKVTVDVAGMTFGITAGGSFIVPRGNTYSINNESGNFVARIFFSQACEPEIELEEV